LLDQLQQVGNIKTLGVVDLEIDADIGVDGLTGPRLVAGSLLQRAGTAELLDPVGAVLVELGFERFEQPPYLFAVLVAILAGQGELG
jgi:hypothetical protein